MRISGEFIIEPLGTMSRTPRHARMPRQQRVASALVLRQIVARIRRVNNTSSSCRRLVLTLAFVVSSLALSSSPLDLGAAEVALKPVAEGFTSPLNLVSLPDSSRVRPVMQTSCSSSLWESTASTSSGCTFSPDSKTMTYLLRPVR
jgi:hypothetical protein